MSEKQGTEYKAFKLALKACKKAALTTNYDFQKTGQLIWNWSRHNTALQHALVRVAIATLCKRFDRQKAKTRLCHFK